MGNFSNGPAYGNWEGDPGHEGAARPMESLQGSMGPVYTQPPKESTSHGESRHQAPHTGLSWDDTFRAPQASPTRGTTNY